MQCFQYKYRTCYTEITQQYSSSVEMRCTKKTSTLNGTGTAPLFAERSLFPCKPSPPRKRVPIGTQPVFSFCLHDPYQLYSFRDVCSHQKSQRIPLATQRCLEGQTSGQTVLMTVSMARLRRARAKTRGRSWSWSHPTCPLRSFTGKAVGYVLKRVERVAGAGEECRRMVGGPPEPWGYLISRHSHGELRTATRMKSS